MKERKYTGRVGGWKLSARSRFTDCSITATTGCTPCSVHCLITVTSCNMGKVFQANRVYLCFHPHYRPFLKLMKEHCREERVLDLHVLSRFEFLLQWRNSSKPVTRFSEDLNLFLHVDSVYLAKQHLRHQELLFIPLGEV